MSVQALALGIGPAAAHASAIRGVPSASEDELVRLTCRALHGLLVACESSGRRAEEGAREGEGEEENDDNMKLNKIENKIEIMGDNDDLDQHRPSYILKHSEEDERWRRSYRSKTQAGGEESSGTGSNLGVHQAASRGDLTQVKREVGRVKDKKGAINRGDQNDWKPIHEASRGGIWKLSSISSRRGRS